MKIRRKYKIDDIYYDDACTRMFIEELGEESYENP